MKKHSGFTLIEVLIYLGLFGIFIWGAISAAYSLMEAGGRDQTKTMLQEEGDFLLAKIKWALSGAAVNNGVILPPLPSDCPNKTQGPALTVSKSDGTSVTISLNGSDMELQKDTDINKLNNSSTQVKITPGEGGIFTHFCQSGGGINPEEIDVRFTLTARTPNGALISQGFSAVGYLKR